MNGNVTLSISLSVDHQSECGRYISNVLLYRIPSFGARTDCDVDVRTFSYVDGVWRFNLSRSVGLHFDSDLQCWIPAKYICLTKWPTVVARTARNRFPAAPIYRVLALGNYAESTVRLRTAWKWTNDKKSFNRISLRDIQSM